MAECILCGGFSGVISFNKRTGDIVPQSGDYTADMVGAAAVRHTHTEYVPSNRTVNGKSLSGNITITASDVGAASSYHTHTGYVPATRTVNGRSLSSNINLTYSDVGAAAVNHTHGSSGGSDASQITGTIPVSKGGTGSTYLNNGQVLIGNGTNVVSTRAIVNNTSSSGSISGSENLLTMNTLRYALNRTTGVTSSDTNYSTSMVRGISAGTSSMTPGSSYLASGNIYIMYE